MPSQERQSEGLQLRCQWLLSWNKAVATLTIACGHTVCWGEAPCHIHCQLSCTALLYKHLDLLYPQTALAAQR